MQLRQPRLWYWRKTTAKDLVQEKAKALAPRAPPPTGPALPLKTTGLEHIGVTVPNPEASAKFYGQIFDPQLFKERDIPNRFYCKMGTAYLAFGTNAEVTAPKIDRICSLVVGYQAQYVRTALEAAGITMGAGALAMPTDGDGMRLQLLGVPGGLAGTIVPGRQDLARRSGYAGNWHRSHHAMGFES